MIDIWIILLIVWLHFVMDFVFQTDKIAINKSSDNGILALHVSIYTIPFFIFGWKFAVITWLLHFMTDWCTSRITKRLWNAGHRHWFFVTIGADQALHMTALFGTYLILMKH